MKGPPTRTVLVVSAVLIVALAVRVAHVQGTSYRPINDAGSYLKLASEIAHTGDYSRHDLGAGGSRGPSAYFPPAYPYFLAAVDLVDGHRVARGAAVHPVRLAQAVLGTITVALIGLVALELFGPTIALIALAIAAAYPVLIELSGVIVAESLLVALELAAVWAVLRARRAAGAPQAGGRPYAWIAGAGVLTGLATLAHENAILLLLPLTAAVWAGRPLLARRSLVSPALLIATALITIAPWTIRNAVVLHRFIPVSDETGITLVGTYNAASAANRQVPYKWRLYYGIPADRALVHEASRLSEADLGDRLLSQALGYIGDHPLSPLAAAYHNTLRLLELEGSFAWHASAAAVGLPSSTALIGVVSFWVICLLAVIGAFTRSARAAPRWIWAVPALFALSVVLVNVETPRFRAPVEPFLVLLAACAVGALVGRLRRSPVGGRLDAAVTRRDGELVEVVQRLP